MSILYGLYSPDEGEIRVNGEPVEVDSPSRAIELGIGMVHQHFMLVPVMTVTENIVLGEEPMRGALLDVREGARRVKELSDRYGLAVDPDAVIEQVSVGMQQRVEILKTLYRDARILILDEPTAVLTAQESQRAVRGAAGAEGGRRLDRLHQPQAERGARDLRPRDGAAARQADRHGAHRGRHGGEPRAADGRPRRAAPGGEGAGEAGRAGARGGGPPRARRARARGGEGRVARGPRGRDRGDRRRGRQRPVRARPGDRRRARAGVGARRRSTAGT